MSDSSSEINKLMTCTVVNCCFIATFIFMGMVVWHLVMTNQEDALGKLLPATGGVGILVAACTTVQIKVFGPSKKGRP
jgi:hypothetical protein